MFVFPRVRYKEEWLRDAPTGSLGLGSRSGWMTSELFPQVLKHIQSHTQCSEDRKILLLMDNHSSHISLDTILFAKDNGIVIVTFPPHCSHRLQPLDIGIYGPFKSYLKVAFNDFMASNPGKVINIYNIPRLVRTAYEVSFTHKNIVSSFKKPGIWPLNRLVFTPEDYDAAYVTDRDLPNENESEKVIDSELSNKLKDNEELNTSNKNLGAIPSTSGTQISNIVVTPEMIRPFPKAPARKKQTIKRERIKSRIYTDTPEKDKILARYISKMKENQQKTTRSNKVCQISSSDSESEELILSDSDDISLGLGSEWEDDNPKLLLDSELLKENQFVLVKFDQKSNNVFYIGEILKVINQNDFDVKFLRKNLHKFIYPLIDDISSVKRNDIVSLLPYPTHVPGTVRTRHHFRFNVDLSNYNMR